MPPENTPELLDQSVAVRISEPKAFGAEHSTGPFPGQIVAVRENTVVVALETPVVFRGEKIVQLVATPSYDRDLLSMTALDRGVPVTLIPITQMDMMEIGDDFTIAGTRRSWFLSGDLMLAGTHDPRLTEASRPILR